MATATKIFAVAVLVCAWSGTSAQYGECESFDTWGYGEDQERKWSACWPFCHEEHQSPIRIWSQDAYAYEMPPLSGPLIDERRTPFRFNITNDNHTVKVQLVGGKNLYLEGGPLPRRYYLDHFAFSWGSTDDRGSEHTNGCQRSAMEVQLGLYSKCLPNYKEALEEEDFYALKIGVLMNIVKDDNPSLAPIVAALPSVRQPGQSASPEEPLVYDGLLGDPTEDFFAYKGSLNMPPCHRRIWWLIYLFGKGISESQVSAFRELRTTAGPMVNNYREPRELDLEKLLASDKNSLCSGRKCSSKHTKVSLGPNLGKYRYCGN